MSDHPASARRVRATDDCEMQSMADRVGLTEVRYGREGAGHLDAVRDTSNPYFDFDPTKCIVCSRCVRACSEIQGTFALTIEGRGFDSKVSAGGDELHGVRVRVLRRVRPGVPDRRAAGAAVVELGMPNRSVLTTCAYCGVGCSFKAELRGDEVVRMVPEKSGGANEGHSCVKGRFAFGYASHPDRRLAPMVRERIADDWREVGWDEAIGFVARRMRRDPGRARHGLDRCDLVVALHERRGLRRPEDGAGGVRQQQRRHLCAGLPLPDRIRPQADVRDVGGDPGLQVGRPGRRHGRHRREPDRRSPGLRVADEAPAAGQVPS